MKTGTPPRVDEDHLTILKMIEQPGDEKPSKIFLIPTPLNH